jgi:hypothetical protein
MSDIPATQETEQIAVDQENLRWTGAPVYDWATGGKEVAKVEGVNLGDGDVDHNFFRMARWSVCG